MCAFEKLGGRKKEQASPNIYALSVSVPASPIHFYALFKSWFAFYISSSIVSFYRGNSARSPSGTVHSRSHCSQRTPWDGDGHPGDVLQHREIPAASATHIITLLHGMRSKEDCIRDAINEDLSAPFDAAAESNFWEIGCFPFTQGTFSPHHCNWYVQSSIL